MRTTLLPRGTTGSGSLAAGTRIQLLAVAMAGALVVGACGTARDATEAPEDATGGIVVPLVPVEEESEAHEADDADTAPACLPSAWHDADAAPEPDAVGTLPAAVRLTEVAQLDAAISATVGPGGVLYLADRSGTIHALTDDGLSDPVVDISNETSTDAERGLLGVAFSPECDWLYVSFTDLDGDSRLDAFPVVDGVVSDAGRRTVLEVAQPFANHNGGEVRVGPDGYVYFGLGDGGSAGDPLDAGQDRTSLLGSVLRIDPTGDDPYAIPGDNPFVGIDGAADEIWVHGLRNPWRFSFDRVTGDLWIADVGQNAREEINHLSLADAGANLGWNRMEGTLPFAGDEPDDHHPPLHEYATTSSRCAVTGGFVYRGAAVPELRGAYVFSDYCEGAIRALLLDAGAVVDEAVLATGAGRVVAFAEDADGELYALSLDGGVRRIDPA